MSLVHTLTVVKTDIRGFTDRSAQMTSSGLDEFLLAHRRTVAGVMRDFHGTVVKEIGDSFLVTFTSSTTALLACIHLQRELAAAPSPGVASARIEVRIAVSAGDVLVQAGDIFGSPVNLAARLESVTPAGEIYFTEAVYQNMNRNEIASESVGGFSFKGIDENVPVYRTTYRHQTRAMTAAVLITDIADFLHFSETAPIAEVEAVLGSWEAAHRAAAEANGGVVQNILADAQVLTFESIGGAIAAWGDISMRMASLNAENDAVFKVQFRSGIDIGEVRVFRSALFGRACNRALSLASVCSKDALLIPAGLLQGLPSNLLSRMRIESLEIDTDTKAKRLRDMGPISVLMLRSNA